ncbi:rod-binding protein [Oceaniglobus ichthyenteri]|uniref:rod-binding protein n=1 Tax=Oceaniglobus ichthyenteri TaxID=2136177 RepID=UPI001F0C999B|nr:rod-binding protein [Oceaniglobus ichthyenteri]
MIPSVSPNLGLTPHQRDTALRDAAQALEVNFLTEILKSTGLGKTSETFGGGAGEDQFASFLTRAQAEKMVDAGGIGLAEHLFNALKQGTKE